MSQYTVKKHVIIDPRANKELKKFSRVVQLKFKTLFEILETEGKLEEPFGRKLVGGENLFEARVKYMGQWRAIYGYREVEEIVILSAFVKKTQNMPLTELEKARKRLADYL